MDFKIVNYHQKYIEQIIQLWNDQLVYDTINQSRFMSRIILDDNFCEKYFKIAILDDKVIGFVWGVKRLVPYLERGLEPTRGFINMIAVYKDYQRLKVGSQLMFDLENQFINDGVKEVTLCAYSPNYLTPGVDVRYLDGLAFFKTLNYEFSSDACSMKCDLYNYAMSQDIKKRISDLEDDGITIKPYQSAYCSDLLEFLNINFGSGWKRNALMAMQQNIAEETIFIACNQRDEIIGFVMRKIDGNDARFGPIGVKGDLRSKGLGGLLLETMMNDMKKREINSMYFLWTHGDAMRFYKRHGFEVYRSYLLSRKEV